MATKSPFPPKSMLKKCQILSISTKMSKMGSNRTIGVVYINFNFDSGGRGDMKEACAILTNIFGEDCLGVVVSAQSDIHTRFIDQRKKNCFSFQRNYFVRLGVNIFTSIVCYKTCVRLPQVGFDADIAVTYAPSER